MKKNHLNVPTEDGNLIYCRKTESVNKFDEKQLDLCLDCPLFSGSIQGRGIECFWNDPRDLDEPYYVTDPQAELADIERHDIHKK